VGLPALGRTWRSATDGRDNRRRRRRKRVLEPHPHNEARRVAKNAGEQRSCSRRRAARAPRHRSVIPAMKRIAGLREIAYQFDLFLVDQYGVLHDGVAAYPGAIDGLARLLSFGRKVIVLTNSGKDAAANLARLGTLGFATSNLHAVLSSGEVALRLVRSGALGPPFTEGADVCTIGRPGDTYAFSSDDFAPVARPQDAAFVVLAGSDAPRTSPD